MNEAVIQNVIGRAGLSEDTSREILAILEDKSGKIPPFRLLKLLDFLESLKKGQFLDLSSKRKPILENFVELLMRSNKIVCQICFLFFEEAYPENGKRWQLPMVMVMELVEAGKMARSEGIKTIIWDLLWRQGGRLAKIVSPNDLTFVLWLNDPITRGKLIMFMFQHFTPDMVMEAICKEISETGRTFPSKISGQFIGLAEAGVEFKKKKRLLPNIMTKTKLTNKEIESVWSEYLKSRNRYELIEIFSSETNNSDLMESFARNWKQLSFDFAPGKDVLSMSESFLSRVHAIRDQARFNREKMHRRLG